MNAIRTISAFLLAFLVLVASTNFKIGVHVCMGKVQNVALFAKAEGCEMERNLPPCHRHAKAPCCEDETILHAAEAFNKAITTVHFNSPTFAIVEQPLVFISEIVPTTPLPRILYNNYDPPLRSCDLTVEHNVFLI